VDDGQMTDAKRWQQLMGVSLHRCFFPWNPMYALNQWVLDPIDPRTSLIQFWILMIYQCSTPNIIALTLLVLKIFKYLINFYLLDIGWSCRTQFWKRTWWPKDHSGQAWLKLTKWFMKRRFFNYFFAYLFLICIIGQNQQKLKVHMKIRNIIC
jgi:hypothetical protein